MSWIGRLLPSRGRGGGRRVIGNHSCEIARGRFVVQVVGIIWIVGWYVQVCGGLGTTGVSGRDGGWMTMGLFGARRGPNVLSVESKGTAETLQETGLGLLFRDGDDGWRGSGSICGGRGETFCSGERGG